MPFVEWVHSLTAGVDHLHCPELFDNDGIILTNAKGVYSSSLAEYVIGCSLYFAKSMARLVNQKEQKVWSKFNMRELRGATMGIIGYGNIGMACAKLASSMGMRVIGLRRNPSSSTNDPFAQEVGALCAFLGIDISVY